MSSPPAENFLATVLSRLESFLSQRFQCNQL